jgi:hypothetical protein
MTLPSAPETRPLILDLARSVIAAIADRPNEANWANAPDEARRSRQQATVLGRMQMSYIKELNRGRAAASRQARERVWADTVTPPAREAGVQLPPRHRRLETRHRACRHRPRATSPVPARGSGRKSDVPLAASRVEPTRLRARKGAGNGGRVNRRITGVGQSRRSGAHQRCHHC